MHGVDKEKHTNNILMSKWVIYCEPKRWVEAPKCSVLSHAIAMAYTHTISTHT